MRCNKSSEGGSLLLLDFNTERVAGKKDLYVSSVFRQTDSIAQVAEVSDETQKQEFFCLVLRFVVTTLTEF